MSFKNKLSLLIPTYCRYGKLARNLSYLSEVATSELIPSGKVNDIEIIIADGSPESIDDNDLQKSKFIQALGRAQSLLNVNYIRLPKLSYFSRIKELLISSTSPYITLLGDEDLFVFDGIDKIFELFKSAEINTVAGRYIDIHGYIRGRLKLSLHEGWLSGFRLESQSAIERLKGYIALRGVGSSPLSYSVNQRDFMVEAWSFMAKNEDKFSYVNAEHFLNHYRVARGSMYSVVTPLYLRDRTFVGRATDEPSWDNPVLDSGAHTLMCEMINNVSSEFSSALEVSDFLKNYQGFRVLNGGPLLEMRSLMDAAQPWLSDYLASQISPATLAACEKAWLESLDFAFPGIPKEQLGIPGFWKKSAQKVFSIMKRTQRISVP